MVDRSILSLLPECELIHILADKAAQRNDIKFDFIGKLNDFRDRVSAEVRQINLLFPEYTPHDEEYHLSRLFHVASLVLGRTRLEGMNSTELFILAISLYGHDWGMAVSEPEKEFILNGMKSRGNDQFWILPDEKQRFSKFLKKKGVQSDNDSKRDISLELWREYIRQTHADRSAERVRKYFENIDGGIADGAARICIGHWLDFEDLEDYHLYPQDFSVLRESANLRALAVYMRLIDLLDLSEDRTPYIIWKFVAPRDQKSKMEWAKHRALHPITCPPYQQGRIIQVDGSTDDHEVYAALEDLRIWCEDQLRGCNDILARMNDVRHKLDIYHIDWRVAARGFKPVSVQFEFERERMFEILGDDIYQSDPYVFLRELLQNSIDAIRVRREVLKRKGIEPGNVGIIRVDVEHKEGCDAIITWTDDGIGMDEFILRNYFAVAGKSYYRSADFEREGLNIDPISRFGIGFLSCFMVSERVEIETYRDPYLPPSGEPLRITIPAVKRQFRIEATPTEVAEVGTKIRVYVVGQKLPKDDMTKLPNPLDITTYLSDVAGFVEFPIVVNEADHKTIILHPEHDSTPVLERLGKDYQIQKIDLTFPWEEAIFPQDLHMAKENLESLSLDLCTDLGLENYEGNLTYLVPKSKTDIFEKDRFGQGKIKINEKTIRWNQGWTSNSGYGEVSRVGASRSARHSKSFSVFRDGILISMARPPEYRTEDYDLALPRPKLIANLPKISTPQVNLARTEILDKNEKWFDPILRSHFNYVIEKSMRDLESKNDVDRSYDLGYITTFHHNGAKFIWETFPHRYTPVLLLEIGGVINSVGWEHIAKKPIYSLIEQPTYLLNEMITLLTKNLVHQTEYDGYLKQWIGDPTTFDLSQTSFLVLKAASMVYRHALRQSHRFDGIRFLRPISDKFPPIMQGLYTPVEIPRDILDLDIDNLSYGLRQDLSRLSTNEIDLLASIFETAYKDPSKLSAIEINLINEVGSSERFFRFTVFENPYAQFFGYGISKINLKNPIGKAILQLYAWIEVARIRKLASLDKIGYFQDKIFRLVESSYVSGLMDLKAHKMLSKNLKVLWASIKEMGINEINLDGLMKHPFPLPEEFIPNTIINLDKFPWYAFVGRRKIKSVKPFGDVLSRAT